MPKVKDINAWKDQPAIPMGCEAEELLQVSLGSGHSIQIQKRTFASGKVQFLSTAGNLFGSVTLEFDDLESLLKESNRQIKAHRDQNSDFYDDDDDEDWG